jgi:hypothetical protein
MVTMVTLALTLVVQTPDFSWSGAVAAGKEVRVKNIVGDVRIEAARGSTVEITAIKRAGREGDPDEVEIRRIETERGVEVCVVYPSMGDRDDDCEWRGRQGREGRRGRRWHEENDTKVHFTVRLPAGVNLNAGTVSGNVDATGLRSNVEVSTVSGNVLVRDMEGKVLEARSVSGDVELTDVRADEVGAETVSGDVDFVGEIRRGGDYDFQTLSGDVVLRVPAGVSAEVTASTFSGSFETSFPLSSKVERESKWARRQRISGTIGNGGATIRLQSFSGDVELLERSGRP